MKPRTCSTCGQDTPLLVLQYQDESGSLTEIKRSFPTCTLCWLGTQDAVNQRHYGELKECWLSWETSQSRETWKRQRACGVSWLVIQQLIQSHLSSSLLSGPMETSVSATP